MTEVAEHWKRGDYQNVIQILQRAQRQLPGNEQIALQLGLTYAMTYDFSAAEQQFELVAGRSKDPSSSWLAIGHQWLKVRQYERGRKCFEQVLAGDRGSIIAQLRLAEFYERQRNLPLAIECAERALHQNPADASALLIRAKLHRLTKQFAEGEKLLRSVLANPNCRSIHPGSFDELGILLDAQGRYDEAMAAFMEGKALCAAEAVKPLAQLKLKQAARKQLGEKFSHTVIERWRKQGKSDFQPQRNIALLAGHARSGTTLLEYVLDSHPSVVSADETFVFSNRTHLAFAQARSCQAPVLTITESLSPRTIRQLRSDYFRGIESYLGESVGERVLVDKNPALTPDIPEFIRIFPEAKLLIALRDPRDICLSCFMQSARLNPDSASWLSLEGTIDNYVSLMGLWLKLKPAVSEFAIEVRYEDIVQNLENNAQRVLEFLNLPWDPRVLKFNEHAQNKIVRSPTFNEVAKPLYQSSVGRWRNYEKYFAPYLHKLTPFLSAFGYADHQ